MTGRTRQPASRAPRETQIPGQTLADTAYQRVRHELVTCAILPGTTFTENEMAQSLQFSKTPIREALLRVRLEGLVRVQSRTGYSATPVTLKDAGDICSLRVLLEGEAAASLAAEHPQRGADRLLQLDASSALADDLDSPAAIEADRQFHLELARVTSNAHMLHALDNVLTHFSRLAYLSLALDREMMWPLHKHDDLIEAISAGDPAQARSLITEEVRRAERSMVAVLIRSHSIASVNISVPVSAHRFYLEVPKDAASALTQKV